ncbi:M14 family zinc carboxypeptidase [Paenarthrobacter sp. NPDC091669]|uniref:M14 family zinc carboxypeptidase n=1 Tax=Paenarthrobacter sp. NPDC091669 TaxID=3364384 RepID=UPI0037FACBCF
MNSLPTHSPTLSPASLVSEPWLPLNEICDRAQRITPLTSFPHLDELLSSFNKLAEASEGRLKKRRLGTSRLNEPIHEYVIGDGEKHIIMVGGVHPNEPIGFHTVRQLAEDLLADPGFFAEFNATWHLIPCIDPDGTRLNEGWFHQPQDRTHYSRNFYRPAPAEQVEWSFPLSHKEAFFDTVIPETQALMRLMVETKPSLLVGLHNAELGGVYYYLNRDLPGAVTALHAIPEALGLPLEVGEPESSEFPPLAEAVYRMPLSSERYDKLEASGLDPLPFIEGGGSVDYAEQFGTLLLVAELPYWTHPDVLDTSETSTGYAAVLQEKSKALKSLSSFLEEALESAEPHLTIDSPLLRAMRRFVPAIAAMAEAESKRADLPENSRFATTAEVFSNEDLVRCFKLRYGSMLLRALQAEVSAGIAPLEVRHAHAKLSATYEDWLSEAQSVKDVEVLPIEKLVGVQYASTLAMAALVSGTA